jgi:CheY-like chemotaxis protein
MENLDNDNKKQQDHNFKQGTLLVVEDNSDHWVLIKEGFQKLLPTVNLIWVVNATEAMDYLNTCIDETLELPRLILLDLYLPSREEGFHFLNAVKSAVPILQRIPVVVLSTSSLFEDVQETYQLGSSSYFVKPSRADEWDNYFKAICDYWGNTVRLPGYYSR